MMDDFDDSSTGAMPLETSDDRDAVLLRLQRRSEALKMAVMHVLHEVEQIKAQVKASDDGNVEILDRQDKMAQVLQANTDATVRIESATAGLVEFFVAMQGAFKVFNWLGKAARPLGFIAAAGAAVAAFWASVKGGKS